MGIVNQRADERADRHRTRLITPHGDCKLPALARAQPVRGRLITPHGDCKPGVRRRYGRAASGSLPLMGIVNSPERGSAYGFAFFAHYPSWGL